MIRKQPHLDCVNPPGQIVTPVGVPASKLYKPVHGGRPTMDEHKKAYRAGLYDTEEAFTPTLRKEE